MDFSRLTVYVKAVLLAIVVIRTDKHRLQDVFKGLISQRHVHGRDELKIVIYVRSSDFERTDYQF